MRKIKSVAGIAAILILFFVAFAFGADEYPDHTTDKIKMSPSCMESFNACRDFMTNRRCFSKSIWKRQSRADASGPFWANRGKRDPTMLNNRLYADEPRWELVRRDFEGAFDPYFTTRGKKLQERIRDRRTEEFYDSGSPFLAARGKRDKPVNLSE